MCISNFQIAQGMVGRRHTWAYAFIECLTIYAESLKTILIRLTSISEFFT